MTTVRCEARREHVVADRVESPRAVPLTVLLRRVPHVGVGRFGTMGETLDDQDEDAADNRRAVPGGDGPVSPIDDRCEDIQGVHLLGSPCRLSSTRLGANSFVTMSPWTISLEAEIDRTYISGIGRGKRNSSLTLIAKLAEKLETTPAALLTPPG